jgi:hypothetical protein
MDNMGFINFFHGPYLKRFNSTEYNNVFKPCPAEYINKIPNNARRSL